MHLGRVRWRYFIHGSQTLDNYTADFDNADIDAFQQQYYSLLSLEPCVPSQMTSGHPNFLGTASDSPCGMLVFPGEVRFCQRQLLTLNLKSADNCTLWNHHVASDFTVDVPVGGVNCYATSRS